MSPRGAQCQDGQTDWLTESHHFYPEDGESYFLQNIHNDFHHYSVRTQKTQSRRLKSGRMLGKKKKKIWYRTILSHGWYS
jgi:hypothetical protein